VLSKERQEIIAFWKQNHSVGQNFGHLLGVGFSEPHIVPVVNTYFESIFQIRNCYYSSSEKSDEMIDLEFLGYCIAYVSVAVISVLFVIAYVRDRRTRKNPRKSKE